MTGGGTGGHIYPAIAIADAIRSRNPRAIIAFAGSRDRLEWRAVPEAGYPIHEIPARGLDRRLTPLSILRNLTVPVVLLRGLRAGKKLIRGFDPDVVIGTGGFVALPVLLAARNSRRVVIQEQNAYVGLTNRIAARFADAIYVAFQEAADEFDSERVISVGNPVRQDLANADPAESRAHFGLEGRDPILLVLGGSGGSRPLNEAVERFVPDLLDAIPNAGVIWQTGRAYYEDVQRRMEGRTGVAILPYIEHMDRAYAAADLALCRAGALTCSELMLTGTPAVLVPSPHVAADHQTKNAISIAEMGGAHLIAEAEISTRLAGDVIDLLGDGPARKRMSDSLLGQARPDAGDVIARDVLRHIEVTT